MRTEDDYKFLERFMSCKKTEESRAFYRESEHICSNIVANEKIFIFTEYDKTDIQIVVFYLKLKKKIKKLKALMEQIRKYHK